MRAREWALIGFTLLMQAAVGTLIVVITASLAAGGSLSAAFDVPLTIAAGAAGLALAISVLHVGRPAGAWLALTNVRTSWLSREIVGSILFSFAVAAIFVQRRNGTAAPVLSTAAAMLGVFVVYAMARVYMVPAQAAWNRPLTLAAFFTSTLLIGVAVVITASGIDPSAQRRLAGVAVGLVALQSVLAVMYVARLPGEPAATISAVSRSTAIGLTAIRIGAAAAAVILLVGGMMAGAATSMPLAILTVAAVLFAETVGRVLFYMGAVSLRRL